MATPIRILSCSQHNKYYICTHKHTHRSSQRPAFPAPAVSASLASVSFNDCLTGSQALAFSSASLSRCSDSLFFSGTNSKAQMVATLTWNCGFFPLSPCISSLLLSINQSVSLPLSVSPFFSCCLSPKSLTLHFYRPHFFISWVLPRHTKAPVDAESPGACMHSSKACNTIAGYSFAHFTLIRALQYGQSVPCNLAVAPFQFWD